MKPEKQRIAIAEACGIDISNIGSYIYLCGQCGEVDANHGFTHQTFVTKRTIPDYLNDLNAMHGALTCQSKDFNDKFANALQRRALDKSKHVHQLEASDWADVFTGLLNADSGESTHE